MPELPFEVDGEVTELPANQRPALAGHEVIAGYHVGEPWHPPPPHEADRVTVTRWLRLVGAELVPQLYEVTYWRRMPEDASLSALTGGASAALDALWDGLSDEQRDAVGHEAVRRGLTARVYHAEVIRGLLTRGLVVDDGR